MAGIGRGNILSNNFRAFPGPNALPYGPPELPANMRVRQNSLYLDSLHTMGSTPTMGGVMGDDLVHGVSPMKRGYGPLESSMPGDYSRPLSRGSTGGGQWVNNPTSSRNPGQGHRARQPYVSPGPKGTPTAHQPSRVSGGGSASYHRDRQTAKETADRVHAANAQARQRKVSDSRLERQTTRTAKHKLGVSNQSTFSRVSRADLGPLDRSRSSGPQGTNITGKQLGSIQDLGAGGPPGTTTRLGPGPGGSPPSKPRWGGNQTTWKPGLKTVIGGVAAFAATVMGANSALDMAKKYQRAQYGDNLGHAERIDTTKNVMNATAFATVAGGFGIYGGYKGLTSAFKRVSGTRAANKAYAAAAPAIGPVQKANYNGESFLKRHPNWSALGIGMGFAAAGAGAGAAFGSSAAYRRPEGRITAINSSPTGGISPALQFSTMGLGLRLHKQSRRM